MATESYCGFARWMFDGVKTWPKSMYFWGMFLIGFSLVMTMGGCPDPWPFRTYVIGLGMVVFVCVREVFKWQYLRYQNELERTERELTRKN